MRRGREFALYTALSLLIAGLDVVGSMRLSRPERTRKTP
jgi:hypothetical protein